MRICLPSAGGGESTAAWQKLSISAAVPRKIRISDSGGRVAVEGPGPGIPVHLGTYDIRMQNRTGISDTRVHGQAMAPDTPRGPHPRGPVLASGGGVRPANAGISHGNEGGTPALHGSLPTPDSFLFPRFPLSSRGPFRLFTARPPNRAASVFVQYLRCDRPSSSGSTAISA